MSNPSLYILKIGGHLLDQPQELEACLAHFQSQAGAKLLVHGGGKMASDLARRLGIQPKLLEGRRITDEATLKIVTMVYAGWINKSLVANLQARGLNALGLSGADLKLIRAQKRAPQPVDYGFAGDIQQIDIQQLQRLLTNGIYPIFSPITHDGQGQLLNTNADSLATALAVALAPFYQVRLRFCFEKNGVLDQPDNDLSVRSSITPTQFETGRKRGTISAGMLPKLSNAFYAKQHLVQHVSIGHIHHQGTEICL